MAPEEGSGGGGGGGGGRKKLRVKKEKASATAAVYAQPIISSSSSTAREESASDTPDEEQQKLGTSEIPERVEQEQLLSAERTLDTSPIEDTLEPAKVPVEEEEEVQTMPKRVLMQKHFKIALEEIRPSASEEGSLPELRKWAEQFGEGGKRRGKKSGFGKGFGFSDEPVKDRDTGYGKVKQDD